MGRRMRADRFWLEALSFYDDSRNGSVPDDRDCLVAEVKIAPIRNNGLCRTLNGDIVLYSAVRRCRRLYSGSLQIIVAPRLHDCSLQIRRSPIVQGEQGYRWLSTGGVLPSALQGMPVVWMVDLPHRRLLPHCPLQSVAIVTIVVLDRVALN